jgi:hypothetical protein
MEKILLQQTRNLSVFEMDEVNRLTSNADGFVPRKDLLASMKRVGFRETQPISCVKLPNGKLRIFDGHNRFVTARYLGIPVWYLAYPKTYAISPLEYSTGQKQWTLKDKTTALACDNEEYAEVVAYSEATGIPQGMAFSLFSGYVGNSSAVYKDVGTGGFSIADRQRPRLVAAIVCEMAKHCTFAKTVNSVLAVSKATCAPGFSADKMVERISKHPELLKPCRTADEYLTLLESIYNRNIKSEKYYLKVEVEKAMKARSAVQRG